jgi:hypothetical protein
MFTIDDRNVFVLYLTVVVLYQNPKQVYFIS